MQEKKRKHHYVFQAYLESWTNEEGRLWCIRDKKNKFCTNTTNIAQIRDFYRLKPINNDELMFLKFLWKSANENVQNALMEHVRQYHLPFEWQKYIEQIKKFLISWYGSCDKVPDEIMDSVKELENYIDISINNTEEDYLSEIEGETKTWIEALKREDVEFIKKIDKFEMYYDLSVQYFRTNAVRERWKSNLTEMINMPEFEQLNIPRNNINLDNIAHFIFWHIQNGVACNLADREAHITILVNKSEVPFVTSDQPIINLCADYSKLSELVDDLIFYYPISPYIAITVNDKNGEDRLELTLEDVDKYNRALIEASYESIFANDKDVITRYISV